MPPQCVKNFLCGLDASRTVNVKHSDFLLGLAAVDLELHIGGFVLILHAWIYILVTGHGIALTLYSSCEGDLDFFNIL
jgi:hypothetical protein